MINAGIFEGGFVNANHDIPIRDRDIVIAGINEQNTVKRCHKQGQKVWLEAAEPRLQRYSSG